MCLGRSENRRELALERESGQEWQTHVLIQRQGARKKHEESVWWERGRGTSSEMPSVLLFVLGSLQRK